MASTLLGSGPKWVPDDVVRMCPLCTASFNVFKRKHHCRLCGSVICDGCSSQKLRLLYMGYDGPVRVCDVCYQQNEEIDQNDDLEEEEISDEEESYQRWVVILQYANHIVRSQLEANAKEGIPERIRGDVWLMVSGAHQLKIKNPGVYEIVCKKFSSQPDKVETQTQTQTQTPPPFDELIKLDISRTFPQVKMFEELDGEGQRKLFRVLKAYSIYNPNVGYKQGMSFLAAVLLTIVPEEDAFWIFVILLKTSVVNTILLNEIDGAEPQTATIVENFVSICRTQYPKLLDFMSAKGGSLEVFANRWFTTLFAYDLPLPIVLKIWDVYFASGFSLSILYKAALYILKVSQTVIFTLDSLYDIIKYFNSLNTPPQTTTRPNTPGGLVSPNSLEPIFIPTTNISTQLNGWVLFRNPDKFVHEFMEIPATWSVS
eukprot:TRINITY_DN668_c0_g1_i4.p1 TRINITY_DN668_c0_g1~~TRINITY_DN668_c0_g1_i4.p1  ORF type:complete len:429 (-),score=79.49 TRINITY_DN668_c0_g1_i4:99-1385(-)